MNCYECGDFTFSDVPVPNIGLAEVLFWFKTYFFVNRKDWVGIAREVQDTYQDDCKYLSPRGLLRAKLTESLNTFSIYVNPKD